MLICPFRGCAAARSPFQKSELDEIGFSILFNSSFFFGKCGRNSAESHRPTVKFCDNGVEKLAVGVGKTCLINAAKLQGFGNKFHRQIFSFHLSKVATAFQKVVCRAGGESASFCNFSNCFSRCLDAQNKS